MDNIKENIPNSIASEYSEALKLYSEAVKDMSTSKIDDETVLVKTKKLKAINAYIKRCITKEEEKYKRLSRNELEQYFLNDWKTFYLFMSPTIFQNQITTLVNILISVAEDIQKKIPITHNEFLKTIESSTFILDSIYISYLECISNDIFYELVNRNIQNECFINLSEKDFIQFVESIKNPPEPSPYLSNAVKEYKEKYSKD